MKILPLLLTGLLAALPAASARADGYAIVGANVMPMRENRVLSDYTVVVRGERIVEVGPRTSTPVPSGATVIEGHGKFLLPGLADMHGHIPTPNVSDAWIEQTLFLFAAKGVTTVRVMRGFDGELRWRDRARELVSPTLYLSGPVLGASTVSSPEDAIRQVRRQKADGWDLLKIQRGLPIETYDALARTAHEVAIRFGGHVPVDVGLLHALRMGQETIDHLDGYIEALDGDRGPVSEPRLQEIVRKTLQHGAWVIPTMQLLNNTDPIEVADTYPELRYAPPSFRAAWRRGHQTRLAALSLDEDAARHTLENRFRILRALHEGGVPVLLGTDAPQRYVVPGFAMRREFEFMLQAGMSPYDILRSGTFNAGRYFGPHDAFGAVEPGMRADLILANANPLEDIHNVFNKTGVMIRGRWIPQEDIDRRLEAIAREHE